MSVRLFVRGTNPQGKTFQEQAETVAVSAHGALLLLESPVEIGQELRLGHRVTQEEATVEVVYRGEVRAGQRQVGVQFAKPSPRFWRVAFPPDDWSQARVAASR